MGYRKKPSPNKGTTMTEEHHRRPRSLGGSNDSSNISYVRREQHRSWHTLFGNLNAFQVCNKINAFSWKPEGVTVVCKFINGNEVSRMGEGRGSRNARKLKAAWELLFGKYGFQENINYINHVWLDPSYHLYVKR